MGAESSFWMLWKLLASVVVWGQSVFETANGAPRKERAVEADQMTVETSNVERDYSGIPRVAKPFLWGSTMSFPYMPLYVGDYLRDTSNLNAEEHGAYLLLIFDLWNSGGKLPADPEDLRVRARVSRRRWPVVWYKLAPKFTLEKGYIEHRRVTAELTKANTKSEVGRRAGMKSAEARFLKRKGSRSTDVQRTFNQSEPEPEIEPLQGSISVLDASNVVPLAAARGGTARRQRGATAEHIHHEPDTAELDNLRAELETLDRLEAKYPDAANPTKRARIMERIEELSP